MINRFKLILNHFQIVNPLQKLRLRRHYKISLTNERISMLNGMEIRRPFNWSHIEYVDTQIYNYKIKLDILKKITHIQEKAYFPMIYRMLFII